MLTGSSAAAIYASAPPSDSHRSSTAAVCARASVSDTSGTPIMSRPSTVASLFGAAAAIMVVCAWSGSVRGGTISSRILLRLSPRTSRVVYRLVSVSAESYLAAAGREFGWCCCPFVEVVDHALDGAEPNR